MRKLLLLSSFALVIFSARAQNYNPFPTTTASWSTDMHDWAIIFPTHWPTLYYQNGDTVVNSVSYHKLYAHNDSVPPVTNPWGPFALLREDNKIIYFKYQADTTERVLYNFNLITGDTIGIRGHQCLSVDSFVVASVDSELTSTGYRRAINLQTITFSSGLLSPRWVEGIGDINNGFMYVEVPPVDWELDLLCFSDAGNPVWNNNTGLCWIGIEENHVLSFTLSPNPSGNYIKVHSDVEKPVDVMIYNVYGQILSKVNFTNELTLNKSDYGSGIYFLKAENSSYCIKFVFL